ncbi:hypothetical protein SUGI_0598280 [Cryptomeria japonica]|nr:hypothetical protein SUGI_0598280 [Cryptomeria japonica]
MEDNAKHHRPPQQIDGAPTFAREDESTTEADKPAPTEPAEGATGKKFKSHWLVRADLRDIGEQTSCSNGTHYATTVVSKDKYNLHILHMMLFKTH